MSSSYNAPLAPYACDPQHSKGRQYSEPAPIGRTAFQRDRDRVIHSSAFRRLVYKTQVFVNHEGDLYRTRLTHSLEVSQIGRSMARALGLNTDLTEALCLAHDLGHTPFGHVGQDALNACMKQHGGFEHNLQSLRIVDTLEQKYANFPGLNLTHETREGILKHCDLNTAKTLGAIGERFAHNQQPHLEAQVMDLADALAYNNHDVDDGLRSGLITLKQLSDIELFNRPYQIVQQQHPNLDLRVLIHEVIRRMIHHVVSDAIATSREHIEASKVTHVDDVRKLTTPLIKLSETTHKAHLELKAFLFDALYSHPDMLPARQDAETLIQTLFNAYTNDPQRLPEKYQQRIEDQADTLARVVADYIAGMTDRFAYAAVEAL